MNPKLVNLLLLASLCCLLAACLATAANSEASQTEKQTARSRFQLPSLFNFAKFKALFHKRYNSFVEELVRQKIFLGRAFRAFISMVKYRHRQLSHYLSVNPRSDQTPEEREQSKVAPEKMQFSHLSKLPRLHLNPAGDQTSPPHMIHHEPVTELDHSSSEWSAAMAKDEIPVATLEDIERQLAEIEANKDKPGHKELAEELERMRQEVLAARRKRDVVATSDNNNSKRNRATKKRDRLRADDLMKAIEEPLSEEAKGKMRSRVPSNNPDYEQVELSSSAAGDEGDGLASQPMKEGLMKMLSQLPGAHFVQQVSELAFGGPQEMEMDGQANKVEEEEFLDAMDIDEDEVYLDMRHDNCLFTPRDQGYCGSCYAFAAIALYEYIFCKETGSLVAFSEQYMVDCGEREQLGGCEGARIDLASEFVENFGLELRLDYPYRMVKDMCPYDSTVDKSHMGRVKTIDPGHFLLFLHDFDHYLYNYKRPIVFSIRVPADFDDYGGGVDLGAGCETNGCHAMLIIGHGREDGEEYYLFRNSHSVSFGEAGYYKFTKRSVDRCACDKVGVIALSHFNPPDANPMNLLNPNYQESAIKQRNQDYLRFKVLHV